MREEESVRTRVEEKEEDKMPPKMRKRWMHREAVALRERYGSPAPPVPAPLPAPAPAPVPAPPPNLPEGAGLAEEMRMDLDLDQDANGMSFLEAELVLFYGTDFFFVTRRVGIGRATSCSDPASHVRVAHGAGQGNGTPAPTTASFYPSFSRIYKAKRGQRAQGLAALIRRGALGVAF